MTRVKVRVLGPLEVEADGALLDLGAPKPRQLLAVLALYRGRPVRPETIVETLWGPEPPASHAVTLQGYVSALRKVLEPDRAPRGAATVIQTSALGYTLHLPPVAFDVAVLEEAVQRASMVARPEVDRPWMLAGSPDPDTLASVALLVDQALHGWRGEPYADLPDGPMIAAERVRLHGLRSAAVEMRELIRLHQGDPAGAARRLETEAAHHPHRERLWLLYAAALVLAERQADGLGVLRRLREALREDLGVDASARVGALETAILQQQVAVEGAATGAAEATAAPAPTADLSGAVGARGGAASAQAPIRVAVVDDHPVFRMGMTALLSTLDGLELVGAAADSAEARELIAGGVDVVLMDLDLGGESGIDLTRDLLTTHPELRVLVMTMHEEDRYVTGSLQAGAAGYLLKSAEAEDVLRAIRGVVRGELIIGSAVAPAARNRLAGS